MSKDIDYNAKVRTNPVFLTAKTAVCLMAEAGIPDAADIVRRLGIHDSSPIPGMTDTVRNINETVKDILAQTGFDSIIAVGA